ncbi:hypothetical protein B296_00017627 [Ensete ventricosum]|uniref:Uncharacterized protein n=1 Tax=Ensete ventricosum TaxID=4639 RepID=A0A427AU61_ENSVE|nr:hypothetical protein B296_00017627 [Ensete ventricosum]
MAGGCIVVKAITNSNTEPLLPSRAPYAHGLSCVGDKHRSFRSYLRWMCVDQSDIRHTMVSWSLFLLGAFILTASHFVLSYAPTHHAYDVVI